MLIPRSSVSTRTALCIGLYRYIERDIRRRNRIRAAAWYASSCSLDTSALCYATHWNTVSIAKEDTAASVPWRADDLCRSQPIDLPVQRQEPFVHRRLAMDSDRRTTCLFELVGSLAARESAETP